MSERVFVTGIGIISSIGKTPDETLQHFRSGIAGIGAISQLNTIHKGTLFTAEVKYTNAELQKFLDLPANAKGYTRTALLGMYAARQAIQSAGIHTISEKQTGLVSANSVGGMDVSENFYESFLNDSNSGSISQIATHDCGDSTEKIADYLGIKDFVTTISTACSSSANAIILGARLIKNGLLDRVVVGGTDSLTKFTINGFNTLLIFDKQECRPFDAERNGLNLGEGAGYLVLESEKSVLESNKTILAELSGYANANDAFHQTASSPDGSGAFMAMQQAIEISGLQPNEIDYINVHGTATQNNDLSEGIALKRIFGEQVPPFSSTKSFTGHTLGAAGGIEAVFSVLAIQNKEIFPSLRFKTPIPELNLVPVTSLLKNVKVKHVLSNSFGFGGNNSTLIFSAV
jgi:3-oxoacyl-(acyl-carrier-protein) synthase